MMEARQAVLNALFVREMLSTLTEEHIDTKEPQ